MIEQQYEQDARLSFLSQGHGKGSQVDPSSTSTVVYEFDFKICSLIDASIYTVHLPFCRSNSNQLCYLVYQLKHFKGGLWEQYTKRKEENKRLRFFMTFWSETSIRLPYAQDMVLCLGFYFNQTSFTCCGNLYSFKMYYTAPYWYFKVLHILEYGSQ